MKKELDIDVKISRAFKLENETCLVKTENSEEKTKIMLNENKLRPRNQE